jgi:hypothetical protein
VPAATPVPRGPTVLTLYTAADLLTGPGCPVCRYASEAADRYLAWFALEGHADAVTVTRLCASLGMCPGHMRGLMSQPGAARRLTALYRYLLRAARDHLADRAARPGGCPACEHDDGAADRALDTLLDGLADGRIRDRYRELGGLCIPHLRAASARGDHRVIAWLTQTMTATITCPDSSGWLAGTGHDADVRAALRNALPTAAVPGSGVCAACLAAARSEADHLVQMAAVSDRDRLDHRLILCAGHLGDLLVQPRRPGAEPLAWQAGCLAAALMGPASSAGRTPGRAGSLWSRRRRGAGLDGCPVCLASETAAHKAIDDVRTWLRAAHPVTARQVPLCVRHLLGLKATDPWAGQVSAPGAIERADLLLAELDAAFDNGTWAHRHEATGPEMTAWRRAASFLDGGVFCGGIRRTGSSAHERGRSGY